MKTIIGVVDATRADARHRCLPLFVVQFVGLFEEIQEAVDYGEFDAMLAL